MVQQSDTISGLAKAFVMAQAEVENAVKNSTNPHFKNTYADLAEVLNTIKPVLSKHGLSISQWPGYDAETGTVTVLTRIMHASGEWIQGVSGSPSPKKDPQGIGSAITYLRRYSAASVLGISQEDDDGEAASRRDAKQQQEHADLLSVIGETNKATPSLTIFVGGANVAIGEYLKKQGSTVKGAIDAAREVVAAINKAKAEAEVEA